MCRPRHYHPTVILSNEEKKCRKMVEILPILLDYLGLEVVDELSKTMSIDGEFKEVKKGLKIIKKQ